MFMGLFARLIGDSSILFAGRRVGDVTTTRLRLTLGSLMGLDWNNEIGHRICCKEGYPLTMSFSMVSMITKLD